MVVDLVFLGHTLALKVPEPVKPAQVGLSSSHPTTVVGSALTAPAAVRKVAAHADRSGANLGLGMAIRQLKRGPGQRVTRSPRSEHAELRGGYEPLARRDAGLGGIYGVFDFFGGDRVVVLRVGVLGLVAAAAESVD